ncbi:hypothetical protein PXD56_13625 [Maribacter sp. SA7]|uniref:hypothetical protein n=1 Tax=Maribacter zhoushanensis TaxID=3030012 RepID=UPI0023EDFDE6|nr:hypothetical protein [Maribacter zhoushanensis]MDF4204007.1 hypothetical protein [Maribacter zhoushanensis]
MKSSFVVIFLFVSFSIFAQSPWTQEKGKVYTQLSFTSISNYDTLFGDPDYSAPGDITDNTIQFYGEYGLSNKTSLLVNLPLKLISIDAFENSSNPDFNTTALGNIEIGVKHNFMKKDWLLSGQFSVEANTATYNSNSGIRTGYDAFTFTPLILAGKSFSKTYIQTFLGANIRTNDYSSNLKLGGEVGYKISNHIWLVGFLDIVKSLENGAIQLPVENILNGLYVNDQEYGAFGFKGIGEITDTFGVSASIGGAFFGNNVAKQAALSVGIYQKF